MQQPTEFEARVIALPRAMIRHVWKYAGFLKLRNGRWMGQLVGEGRNRRSELLPPFNLPREIGISRDEVMVIVFLGKYVTLTRNLRTDDNTVHLYCVKTNLFGRADGSLSKQGGGHQELFISRMPNPLFGKEFLKTLDKVPGGWVLEHVPRYYLRNGRTASGLKSNRWNPYDTESQFPFKLLPSVYPMGYERCYPWGKNDFRTYPVLECDDFLNSESSDSSDSSEEESSDDGSV